MPNPISVSSVLSDLTQVRSKLTSLAGLASSSSSGASTASPGTGSFADLLHQAIAGVASSQNDANQLSTEFEQGNPNASLPQVMIAVEKANLSFDGMAEARNKLVDAYNQIMNMQV